MPEGERASPGHGHFSDVTKQQCNISSSGKRFIRDDERVSATKFTYMVPHWKYDLTLDENMSHLYDLKRRSVEQDPRIIWKKTITYDTSNKDAMFFSYLPS